MSRLSRQTQRSTFIKQNYYRVTKSHINGLSWIKICMKKLQYDFVVMFWGNLHLKPVAKFDCHKLNTLLLAPWPNVLGCVSWIPGEV